LKRLEEVEDGSFQHGFKKGRNTTTAALELQDFVSRELDNGKTVGTYSLDLSAAFDLLRPDLFEQIHKDIIPLNLMPILIDFMSARNFKVQIGKATSEARFIKVGCVQGSILGPKLFTLYMSQLQNKMHHGTHLVAYADDAYVSIAADSPLEVKRRLECQLKTHEEYLTQIGMVTNTNKTELIYFSRKPIMDPPNLEVDGIVISPKKQLKVLGMIFQDDLREDAQVSRIIKSCKTLIPKLRFLGRFLTREQMKTVVTAQFYSRMYYGCEIWLNDLTAARSWRFLNSLHYKALRVIVRDQKNECQRPF